MRRRYFSRPSVTPVRRSPSGARYGTGRRDKPEPRTSLTRPNKDRPLPTPSRAARQLRPGGVGSPGCLLEEGRLRRVDAERDLSRQNIDRPLPTPSRAADRLHPGGVGSSGCLGKSGCRTAAKQGPRVGEPSTSTVQIAATGPAASNGPIGAHEAPDLTLVNGCCGFGVGGASEPQGLRFGNE